MNKAAKLYAEYQRKLKALQSSCLHAKLTDWMDELYGPCHSTGDEVRLCGSCDRVMERRKAQVGHSKFVFG